MKGLARILLRGSSVLAVAGALALPAPRAASADTVLAAPADLRLVGVDTDGFPILSWTRSADDAGQVGTYYEILYVMPGVTDTVWTGTGQPGYDTSTDAWGHCLAEGTYLISVRFLSYPDASPSTSSIEAYIPKTI